MRRDIVAEWAQAQGIALSEAQMNTLAQYQALVLDTNQRMNLTAITDPADMAVKHIIDSMTLLPWLPQGARVVDIGTGAGFPGLVLRILRPDLQLTLVDSLNKRVNFLRETVAALGLGEIPCIHARAEDLVRPPKKGTSAHMGAYDICTARAVAKLDVLAGYALPLLAAGGLLLAMKGPDVTDELAAAQHVIAKHGGQVQETARVQIAPELWRTIVVICQK